VARKNYLFFLFLCSGCSVPFWHKAEKGLSVCAIKSFSDVISLFPKTSQEISVRVQKLRKDIRLAVQKVIVVPDDNRTFANTALALDNIGVMTSLTVSPLGVLKEVSTEKAIRDASYSAILELQPFLQEEVSKNVKLFRAFKAYFDGNAKKEKLTDEERYYLDEVMRGYKREGLLLPPDELEKVKKLKNELMQLALQFSKNIADVDTKISFTKEQLAGLSDQVLATLRKDEDGNYLVGLDYPTVFPILKHANDSETRKKVYLAFQKRAYPANYPILKQMMEKRDAVARLLGFENYVSYDLDDTMAKDAEKIRAFLGNIMEKARKKQQEEFVQLTAELPDSVVLAQGEKLNPWDSAYLKEAYKKKHLDLDDAKMTEYFPVEHVLPGIFSIYQQFLGLRFEEFACNGLWHESVKCISVFDNHNRMRGYLILDLYPRPNKFSHACMIDVISTQKIGSIICPAVIAILANFPKKTKEYPGLLKFDDVRTFFHEFGHAMHGMLGATCMHGFSGTSVKTDFVETPSQMFEEWLHDKDILKNLSKHYQTGESLPDDMIEKLIELDKFDAGDFHLRQLGLGLFSLGIFEKPDRDIQHFYKDTIVSTQPYMLFSDEMHLPANFGHLTGYAVKYYSYLWAKVFAMDLFEQVKKQGLLNPAVGMAIVEKILSKGGSVEPETLLKDFLGREPNQEAFLKHYGFMS